MKSQDNTKEEMVKMLYDFRISIEQKQKERDAKIIADYCATNQIIFKEDALALQEKILNS